MTEHELKYTLKTSYGEDVFADRPVLTAFVSADSVEEARGKLVEEWPEFVVGFPTGA